MTTRDNETNTFWNPKIEKTSPEKIRKLQEKKLRILVNNAYKKSAFYKKLFDDSEIKPENIKTLDDLTRLPLTTKRDHVIDHKNNFPFGSMNIAKDEDIVEVYSTSGTTGKRLWYPHTRESLEDLGDLSCYGLVSAGVTKKSLVYILFNYGTFGGFWNLLYGVKKIGALVVPGGGSTEDRLHIIKELKPNCLVATPSYLLRMMEKIRKQKMDATRFKVDTLICTGEPLTEKTREKIEDFWDGKVYQTYGAGEIGPIAFECNEQDGMHILEDSIICEVINPDTGENIESGEEGEVVFTGIGVKSLNVFPTIRYKSGDWGAIETKKCRCSRTLKRVYIKDRVDDMKKIRGVSVFPSAIESIISSFPELGEFQVIIHRVKQMDEILIKVESLEKGDKKKLKERLKDELKASLGLKIGVEILPFKTLPRYKLKAKRLIDMRKEVPF